MSFKLFSKDDGHLARTRKEQFGYIIRNNVPSLFLMNVLTFLFSIPLIITLVGGLLAFHNLSNTADVTSSQLFSVFLITGLATIPSFVLFGIGLAGLYNCLYCLVFNSSTKVSDFFKGIKSNFKPYLINNLIFGIVTGLLIINLGNYFFVASLDASLKLIILIVNLILLFTLLIGKGFTNFEISVFKNPATVYIRNGIFLFYKRLPVSLIVLGLIVLPIVAFGFLPVNYVFVPAGILATFYISFSSLAIFLISLDSYEKSFPEDQIKEIYHKGLENINF